MKVFFLFLLFFILSMAYNLMLDLISGMKLSMSLKNMLAPFKVISMPEIIIVFTLLIFLLIPLVSSFFKKNNG